MDIVEKLLRQADADDKAGTLYAHEIGREAAAEIERLRKRCNPSMVVMIGGTGHYVSEAVAEEIERLCDALRRITEVDPGTVTTSYDMRRIATEALTPNAGGNQPPR